MIQAIRLPGLRNGEFIQFSQDVLAAVELGNPVALNVVVQFNSFSEKINELELLFKPDPGSMITNEIVLLDNRRDSAFTGFSTIIRGFTYSFIPEQKAAALLLNNLLTNFGTVTTDNLQSETASMRNILADITAQRNLSDAVNRLSLTDWVTELNESNTLFEAAYRLRAAETGTNSNNANIRELRLEAYELYYALKDFINAFYTINQGAAPYAEVVDSINGLIISYNNLMAKRGEDGEEETPPPPTPAP